MNDLAAADGGKGLRHRALPDDRRRRFGSFARPRVRPRDLVVAPRSPQIGAIDAHRFYNAPETEFDLRVDRGSGRDREPGGEIGQQRLESQTVGETSLRTAPLCSLE